MFSRVFVLQSNLGLAKHFMMLSLLESNGIRVSICEYQLYFLFMVSPSILSDATIFMLEFCVVIIQLHLCLLHMCRCSHLVCDRDAPE